MFKYYSNIDLQNSHKANIAARVLTDEPVKNSSYFLDDFTIDLILHGLKQNFAYLATGIKLKAIIEYDSDINSCFISLAPKFSSNWTDLFQVREPRYTDSDYMQKEGYVELLLREDSVKIDVSFLESLTNQYSIDFFCKTAHDYCKLTNLFQECSFIELDSKLVISEKKILAALKNLEPTRANLGAFETDIHINGIQTSQGNWYSYDSATKELISSYYINNSFHNKYDDFDDTSTTSRVSTEVSVLEKKSGIALHLLCEPIRDIVSKNLYDSLIKIGCPVKVQGPVYSSTCKGYVYQAFYVHKNDIQILEIPFNAYTLEYIIYDVMNRITSARLLICWKKCFSYIRQYFDPKIYSKLKKQIHPPLVDTQEIA